MTVTVGHCGSLWVIVTVIVTQVTVLVTQKLVTQFTVTA